VHAGAIVAHIDKRFASVANHDGHLRGAGIERILHKLLDHRFRTLHHLSGRDLVSKRFRKSMYTGHEMGLRWRRLFRPPLVHTAVTRQAIRPAVPGERWWLVVSCRRGDLPAIQPSTNLIVCLFSPPAPNLTNSRKAAT